MTISNSAKPKAFSLFWGVISHEPSGSVQKKEAALASGLLKNQPLLSITSGGARSTTQQHPDQPARKCRAQGPQS